MMILKDILRMRWKQHPFCCLFYIRWYEDEPGFRVPAVAPEAGLEGDDLIADPPNGDLG